MSNSMTLERAIEILNPEHLEHYDSIETVNEACRVAVKALKKQIPKKPIFDEDKELYVCPVCKELNAYAPDDFNDFCELCGQAIDNSLDWSDEECANG